MIAATGGAATASTAATWVIPGLALGSALLGLITWFVRDRRKSRAESAVAEQSIQSDVDLHDTDARDARLVYIQRQVDMERAFHVQQIADRDAEIGRQRAELAHRDSRIASLLEQVGRLEAQLAEVSRQMTSVRAQLNELADHDSPNGGAQ